MGVDQHLHAALAVWDYCERSARWVFGERLGDKLADAILEALQSHKNGMTRTEINDLFNRNKKSEDISRALQFLQGHGKAEVKQEIVEGAVRPVERWFAVTS